MTIDFGFKHKLMWSHSTYFQHTFINPISFSGIHPGHRSLYVQLGKNIMCLQRGSNLNLEEGYILREETSAIA